MAELDLTDIQGVVYRGYGRLPAACFVLLKIPDDGVTRTRTWLKGIAGDVTTAESKRRDHAVQIAFTREGLRLLGLDETVTHFSCEFEDGLIAPHKQRTLGDHDESAPEKWVWGGPETEAVHVLLMLYASAERADDNSHLDQLYQEHSQRFTEAGLIEVEKLPTRTLIDRKEHFGFTDGIAQPILAGTRRAKDAGNGPNVVPLGEFLLGHENGYGKLAESPTIPEELDREGLLPQVEGGGRDLGHNGTYLVFRQLEQDVRAFWRLVDEATQKDGESDPAARDRVAAKMIGRWRNGVSLMKAPTPPPSNPLPDDRFSYAEDPNGLKCPVGSHIRRTNPRDSVFRGTSEPLTAAKQHRILRRGRPFGPPVAASMEPEDILAAEDSGEARGLHFLCVNADLGRQFEFVQHTWINNPKFADGYSELDPILGDHGPRHRASKGEFWIPATPLRQRITGLTRFVHVVGGAYFFLPGINAVRVIADLGDNP